MTSNHTVAEIKILLKAVENLSDPFLETLKADDRKGVQAALRSKLKEFEKIENAIKQKEKMLNYERSLRLEGYKFIAGIDEVGRGPLAGPVVAAAVILPDEVELLGLMDSKQLTAARRQELSEEIQNIAVAVGIGEVEPEEIDRINIRQATHLAMKRALDDCKIKAEFALIDAETIKDLNIPQQAIIKGDIHSYSIAAASIIAKVYRDAIMEQYDLIYPYYGFSSNSGYGTAEHLAGLEEYGPSPVHRTTFAPVKKYF